jgi:hypothetical protein
MIRHRLLRLGLATMLASVALHASSCGSDDATSGGTSSGGDDLADVIYEVEGGGGDEALEALLSVEPVREPSKFAVLSVPVEGQAFEASAPPTFAWDVEQAAQSRVLPGEAPRWLAPRRDVRTVHARSPLDELFGPIRSAHAHGPPVNGEAYLLVIEGPDDDELLRVFTTKTSYTPDETTWNEVAAAAGPLTAWVLMGIFDENRIAPDGGPFPGPRVAFTIER